MEYEDYKNLSEEEKMRFADDRVSKRRKHMAVMDDRRADPLEPSNTYPPHASKGFPEVPMSEIDTSPAAVERLCAGPLTDIARSKGLPVTAEDVAAVVTAAATLRALSAKLEAAEDEVARLRDDLSQSEKTKNWLRAELEQYKSGEKLKASSARLNKMLLSRVEAKGRRYNAAKQMVLFWADEIRGQASNLEELDKIGEDGSLVSPEAVGRAVESHLRRNVASIASAAVDGDHP